MFTLHFCRKLSSFKVFPMLGEFCFTSKSAKCKSRSNRWLAKRWLIGAFRSFSNSRAERLLKKCRSIRMDCLFNRLDKMTITMTVAAIASTIPTAAFSKRATGSMTRPIHNIIRKMINETNGPRLYLLSSHNCWNSAEWFFFIMIARNMGAINSRIRTSEIPAPRMPESSFMIKGAMN